MINGEINEITYVDIYVVACLLFELKKHPLIPFVSQLTLESQTWSLVKVT